MDVQIVSRADGSVKTVALDQLNVAEARIIRLAIDPATVQSVSIQGQDLVIVLKDGETIRIPNYSSTNNEASPDVVFVDGAGENWLASLSDTGSQFGKVNWDDLVGSSLAAGASSGGGAGGLLLPIIGGLGAIGGIGAAAGGGGGNGGGQNNTPRVFAARLEADTGKSSNDGITSNGKVLVTGLQDGATWQYRVNGGEWKAGGDGGFTLPEGTHIGVEVRELLSDGTQNKLINLGTITVDTSMDAVTAELTNDTGVSDSDGITSDGRVTVENVTAGDSVEYQTSTGGAWIPFPSGPYTLPEGSHENVSVRVVDAAGNVSNIVVLGPVAVDSGIANPAAALANDLGVSDSDGITSDGTLTITGLEVGAIVYYRADEASEWLVLAGAPYVLPEGAYPNLAIQVQDQAGNLSDIVILGPVEIDVTPPNLTGAALVNDTGASGSDLVTSDGTIAIGTTDSTARAEYRLSADGPWVAFGAEPYRLPEGVHSEVSVRVVDVAGNSTEQLIGAVTIDTAAPTLSVALVKDTGISDTDSNTSNGALTVTTNDPDATVEYRTSDGGAWTVFPSFPYSLPEGIHPNVSVRVTDTAGNETIAALGPVTVDTDAPDLGAVSLENDTGIAPDDLITADGTLSVVALLGAPLESGAIVQYRSVTDTEWNSFSGTDYILDEGEYRSLAVRVIDTAGNASDPILIGTVVVDKSAPTLISATLADDTGVSGSDGITENPALNIVTDDPDAIVQYRTSANGPWVSLPAGSVDLPFGAHSEVSVRLIDMAGNVSGIEQLGALNILSPVRVELVEDTGVSDSDQITNNGEVLLLDLPVDATYRYRTGPLEPWQAGQGISFTLAPGSYPDVQVQITYAGGYVSNLIQLGTVTVDILGPTTTSGLAEDTGAAGDRVTSNGTLAFTSSEAGSMVQVRLGPDQPFVTITGTSLNLVDGYYDNVVVRSVDVAGNIGAETPIAPFRIDRNAPNITAALNQDTGLSDSDGITSNGQVDVAGLVLVNDPAALLYMDSWQYRTGENEPWQQGSGSSFTLPTGAYGNVQVQAIDAAGNVGDIFRLGPIAVSSSVTDLENIRAFLTQDTGSSNQDGVTSVGSVTVSGLGADMTYVYYLVDQNGVETGPFTPSTPITVPDHSFALDEGRYNNVKVTIMGGDGSILLTKQMGPIVVDMTAPTAPTAALMEDSGTAGDGVTNNGTVIVSGIETGASWEYSLGDPVSGPWITGVGDRFILDAGQYGNIYVRQIDLAGNVGSVGNLANIEVLPLEAVDDHVTADLGPIVSTSYNEEVNSDIQVLGLLESSSRSAGPQMMAMSSMDSSDSAGFNLDNSVSFTVSDDHYGEIIVGVKQTSLLALADAFRLDIVDASGNVVYSAVTQNSLVGDVAGLGLLGLTGDDRLTARVSDLPPGEYHVVVRNSPSALEQLLNGSEGGISLENLGQGGAILGDHNQQVILEAVNQALGGRILGTVVSGTLGLVLNGLNLLPVTHVVKALSDFLSDVGLLSLLDMVKDNVAHALLSNTLTLLQKTTVYTQLTEYNFASDAVTGNVIIGDNGTGADRGGADAFLVSITNADGVEVILPTTGSVQVDGRYGTLTISADGSYSYVGNGTAASLGEMESFRYTLSNGRESDSANLNITIGGQIVTVAPDTVDASVEWGMVTDPRFFRDVDTLIGSPLKAVTTTSDTFTIGQNMSIDGSVILQATVAYNQSGTLVVQKQNAGGGWDAVHTMPFSVQLAVIGNVGELDLGSLDLAPGTYRVQANFPAGLAALVYVNTEITAIYEDRTFVKDAPIARGNYLANDDIGIGGGYSEFRNPETGDYIRVERGHAVEIEGEYGVLTVRADGSYSYQVASDAPYFDQAVQDVFEYRLVNVNGQSATSSITISIEPTGAGVMRTSAMRMDDLLDNYLGEPAATFGSDDGDGSGDIPPMEDDLSYLMGQLPLGSFDDPSQAVYI